MTQLQPLTQLANFCAGFPAHTYQAGETVVSADETPHFAYYIESGKIRQIDTTPTGTEVTLNMYGPTAFLALTWLLGGAENRYYFLATEPTIIHKVPADQLQDFLRNDPGTAFAVLERVSRGLDGALQRIAMHLGERAGQRIALELLIEAQRFATSRDGESYRITVSVNELAARSGLARETASRQLTKLQKLGLILKNSKDIHITHLDRLKEFVYTSS